MKHLLILGAGRSSFSLIQYLLETAYSEHWLITVGDSNLQLAQEKIQNHPNGRAVRFNADNLEICEVLVQNADLVISMLPHFMHRPIAELCVKFGKHFLTASYLTPEIKALNNKAIAQKVILLNEMGLDPGIDHMSAMQIIDGLKKDSADIRAFKSYTGGLVAPEYDTNPWNYKFTWNPRNVILAGQGTAQYIIRGKYKYMPYHRLFSDLEEITVSNYDKFEGYPNRDSLKYRVIYGLENTSTLIRGTLRKAGFCQSWDAFVQLGMTDDGYKVENSENTTYRDFINAFLPYDLTLTVPEKVAQFLGVEPDSEIIKKLNWLGLFRDEKIGLENVSPAQILQHVLEKKWKLAPNDKDMIVMQHIFEYEFDQKQYRRVSSLVVKGEDTQQTAMAKTVGLPLGIVAKFILKDEINLTGVQLPVHSQIYEPVLKEMESHGIQFEEEIEEI